MKKRRKPVEIIEKNGSAFATSIQVAEHFGKEHKNVLRAIRHLITQLPEDWARLNFEQSVKLLENPALNAQTPLETPIYLMTRDGFSFLAMGFTGKRAVAWKLKYIEAFNAMEVALQKQASAKAIDAGIRERMRQIWPPPRSVAERMGIEHKILAAETAYWALREGISFTKAKSIVSAIGRIDNFDDSGACVPDVIRFIEREIYRPGDDNEPATNQQLEAINLLVQACYEMNELGMINFEEHLEYLGIDISEINMKLCKKRADSIALILYNILERQLSNANAIYKFKVGILHGKQK